jgi:3-methylfumaryl-CoA hydratase
MADTIDVNPLRDWIGKHEAAMDRVTPAPIAALRATLDIDAGAPKPGDTLPPLWHWLYFLPFHNQSDLSENGHPRAGDFMPPVTLTRRMYAGGRLQFHRPLRVGDAITRNSTIADISAKQGRTGPLVFLTIKHEVSNQRGLAVTEEQDIVYRDSAGSVAAARRQSAPDTQAWLREMKTDPVLLFRFSALTFNGHRIHYDYPYTTGVEGYPGLIVHGPLLAVLLMELLHRHRPEAAVREFQFRAARPVFNAEPFFLCGEPDAHHRAARLWVRDAGGGLCFDAAAALD